MTSNPTKNIAGSVRDRLLDLARRRGEDFQLVLLWAGTAVIPTQPIRVP